MSNNSVKFWNETWRRERDRHYRHFEMIANKIGEKQNILDIGCGCGTLLRYLRNVRPDLKLFGTDISDYAVKRLKSEFFNAKVEKLPKISVKNIGTIVATEVFEHIKNDNELFNNCSKTANELIMTVPNDRLGPEECDEHERKYTAKSLAEKISKYYKHFEIYTLDNYLLAICWNTYMPWHSIMTS